MLNRISRTKKVIVTVNSDHNVLVSKFDIKWSTKVKSNRVDMFNLKNREDQQKFKEMTSNTDMFSSIFNKEEDLNISTKKFLKC